METQNYDDSSCDYGFSFNFDFDIDDNKVYLDEDCHCYVDSTLYYLVKAVVNHRINQLDKDLIHRADDLLGNYFKEGIDGEDVLALCCLDRLIELGQVPIMEISRNDNNGRKYILL